MKSSEHFTFNCLHDEVFTSHFNFPYVEILFSQTEKRKKPYWTSSYRPGWKMYIFLLLRRSNNIQTKYRFFGIFSGYFLSSKNGKISKNFKKNIWIFLYIFLDGRSLYYSKLSQERRKQLKPGGQALNKLRKEVV